MRVSNTVLATISHLNAAGWDANLLVPNTLKISNSGRLGWFVARTGTTYTAFAKATTYNSALIHDEGKVFAVIPIPQWLSYRSVLKMTFSARANLGGLWYVSACAMPGSVVAAVGAMVHMGGYPACGSDNGNNAAYETRTFDFDLKSSYWIAPAYLVFLLGVSSGNADVKDLVVSYSEDIDQTTTEAVFPGCT